MARRKAALSWYNFARMSFAPKSKLFTRERYGTPQVIAVVLLLLFLGQCAWFISRVPLTQVEANYIQAGWMALRPGAGRAEVAGRQMHSPLVPMLAGAPAEMLMRWRMTNADAELGSAPTSFSAWDSSYLDRYRWLIRAPFVLAGLLLGASLWYVARRLYGNAGGYIALGLYAFSPGIVIRSSMATPEIIATWGLFGTIFTAIAVSHTLYAPREVVLWNWRRILLLGFCIFLTVGAQFSLVWLLLLALGFMWWAVPHRRGAALLILTSSTLVALVLLWGVYGFRVGVLIDGLARAQWLGFVPRMFASQAIYGLLGGFFVRDAAATALMALIAFTTYLRWKRARFFGNSVPLIVAATLVVLGILMAHVAGLLFLFAALPFLIVFASGVFADLLETPRASVALGIVAGVLATQAVLSIYGLVQLTRGLR
ncbi:MAG TPA: hypothetical protein VN622_11780 [Clostridia bacterium]|nr:hypothetical protein [Clostridia bacterium]